MSKNIRVTHILYSGLGGHGSVFFSLAKSDSEKEFSLYAIFCGIEKVREDYVNKCNELQIPFNAILKKKGADPGFYRKVFSSLKKSKPDVIFLHAAGFILPALLYKVYNPSVKIVIRDTQAHHLKTRMDWTWSKLASRIANKLVFLTKESYDDFQKKFSDPKYTKKSVIIPNGLDTDLYSPVNPGDLNQRIILGMQSRLQQIKDHPTLIRAFASLLKRIPDKTLKLRIAGDGETMDDLKALVKELNIEQHVELVGMLDEKDLVSFMQSLDIYVHATFGETMSNSIMQAMSSGLPIIASDVWGVSKMIKHRENGLLYQSESVEELTDAMNELINDHELRHRIARSARDFAEKNYSLSTMFNNYKKVLI